MFQRSLRSFRRWTIFLVVVLILTSSFGTLKIVEAQHMQNNTGSTDYNSGTNTDKLDTIIKTLNQTRQGSLIALYITIIAFLIGLAFVIFGLYIRQEQNLATFTKRLYIFAYFVLIVPITVIIIRYIVNTTLSGEFDDPILPVALLLLIPTISSYILMIVKIKHDILLKS